MLLDVASRALAAQESGWFDGEDWRLCESGGVVNGRVLSFAQPEGPC